VGAKTNDIGYLRLVSGKMIVESEKKFSTVRKLAINLLNLEKTTRLGVPRQMAKASR